MSCNLTDDFEFYRVVQKNYYEAPPKRQLLIEKFGDYAKNLEEEAYWVLKYNNALSLDNNSIMTISSIKIDGKKYVAHYWPEDEFSSRWEIMLQEMYGQFKIM